MNITIGFYFLTIFVSVANGFLPKLETHTIGFKCFFAYVLGNVYPILIIIIIALGRLNSILHHPVQCCFLIFNFVR